MNVKVGFRRVYILLHVCWVLVGLALYLLDWPGDRRQGPEWELWMTRADRISTCQSRARSYEREEMASNTARLLRNGLPEVPNFGRDERGLQVTTLKDALRECEQRYPFPRTDSGYWREIFRDMRHESASVRAMLAVFFFFVPALVYLLSYALTLAVVSSFRWIRRGFMASTGS